MIFGLSDISVGTMAVLIDFNSRAKTSDCRADTENFHKIKNLASLSLAKLIPNSSR